MPDFYRPSDNTQGYRLHWHLANSAPTNSAPQKLGTCTKKNRYLTDSATDPFGASDTEPALCPCVMERKWPKINLLDSMAPIFGDKNTVENFSQEPKELEGCPL